MTRDTTTTPSIKERRMDIEKQIDCYVMYLETKNQIKQ